MLRKGEKGWAKRGKVIYRRGAEIVEKQSKTHSRHPPDGRCHNNCRRPFFTIHISLIALLHFNSLVSIICDAGSVQLWKEPIPIQYKSAAACSVGGSVTGHSLPCPSYAGCQHPPAEMRLDLSSSLCRVIVIYYAERNLFGGLPVSRCWDPPETRKNGRAPR